MNRPTKYALIAAAVMFFNLIVGPMGLFAYWGWPDFPSWVVPERVVYWVIAQVMVATSALIVFFNTDN